MVISGFASSATIVKIFDNGTLIGSTATDAWTAALELHTVDGTQCGQAQYATVVLKSGLGGYSDYSDEGRQPSRSGSDPHHPLPVFDDHVGPDQGPGAISNGAHDMTFTIDADPTAYFQQANAHVQGDHSGQDTIALTGDHQILDLTALSGKTAAAKISGVEVFDLGGHQNTLKVSLLDVLNLGEQDLFIHDGKQQVVVKGATGDAVDLVEHARRRCRRWPVGAARHRAGWRCDVCGLSSIRARTSSCWFSRASPRPCIK